MGLEKEKLKQRVVELQAEIDRLKSTEERIINLRFQKSELLAMLKAMKHRLFADFELKLSQKELT